MSDPYIVMLDSANPAAPGLKDWTGPVQGYCNHVPPWTTEDYARFPGGHMVTSVRPEASWAAQAREIDVETGAASEADIVPFILERERLGHRDAGVYFSRDRWPAVLSALVGGKIGPMRVRLRVADWSVPPTRFDLGDGYIVWAHQYRNDPVLDIDRTAVFGRADFTRP